MSGMAKSEALRARWESYREPAFWKRVEKRSPSECWPWSGLQAKGSKNPHPYGQLGWRGKVTKAHRVAYEIANGEIPPGAMVLHRCDNSLCCNPAHLYLGDHMQNMRDMVDRKRRAGINAGEENGRSKLNRSDAMAIRKRYSMGGVTQQALADKHGISQHAVSKIVRNVSYRA